MPTRQIWFGILSWLLCCGTAVADDVVVELSKQLGNTPALVVVVCSGEQGDLPIVAQMVEATPWTIFCCGPSTSEMGELRQWASEKQLLGRRVYVADGDDASCRERV